MFFSQLSTLPTRQLKNEKKKNVAVSRVYCRAGLSGSCTVVVDTSARLTRGIALYSKRKIGTRWSQRETFLSLPRCGAALPPREKRRSSIRRFGGGGVKRDVERCCLEGWLLTGGGRGRRGFGSSQPTFHPRERNSLKCKRLCRDYGLIKFRVVIFLLD